MNARLSTKDIIWIIPATCTFIFVVWLLPSVLGFLCAASVFLLMALIFKMFYNSDSLSVSITFKSTSTHFLFRAVPYLCAVFCIVLQYTVGSMTDYYLSWADISPLNYLRAFGFIAISVFFVGYFILVLLGLEKRLTRLETFVYSYILSIVIVTVSTYYLSLYTKIFYTTHITILTSVLLALAAIRTTLPELKKHSTHQDDQFKITFSAASKVMLILTFLTVLGIAAIFSGNPTLISGDMWRHNGWSVMITRNVLPDNYAIFHLYIATNMVCTGLPILNTHELIAVVTAVVLVLSFYLMVRTLMKDVKKSVIASVFFVIGGGFGGLLFLYNYASNSTVSGGTLQSLLNQVNIQSMLDTRYLYLTPDWFTESITVFICVFCLMHFLVKEKGKDWTHLLLVPVAVFAGYSDRPEIVIFFVALFVLSILSHEKDDRRHLIKISILSIIGLLFCFFYADLTYMGEILLITLLALAAFASLAVSTFRYRIVISRVVKGFRTVILVSLLYIVCLCLIIWAQMRSTIFNNFTYITDVGMVPWYTYPVMLGIFSLIVIAGLFRYKSILKEDKRMIALFLSLSVLFIILGRLLTFINTHNTLSFQFWEIRTVSWARLFLVIVAAYFSVLFLDNICSKLKKDRFTTLNKRLPKTILVGCIIAVIVFASCASTLVKIGYWTNYSTYGVEGEGGNTVSAKELDAVNYLRINAQPYSQAIALSDSSWEVEKWFAGLPNTFDRPSVFYNTTQSSLALRTLATQDYIYLPERDQNTLDSYSESYLKDNIMPYLPVVFNNSEVTIYNIPELSIPNSNSTFAYVTCGTGFQLIDDNLLDWAVHAQSGTIKNLALTYSNGVSTLSGILNSSVRDYYLLSLPVSGKINTNDYPSISIKWKSTDYCATFEVKYTDGTYLTNYAASKIVSRSLPDWTITAIDQPANKTIDSIILGIDDRYHTTVSGSQSISINYMTLKSVSSENAFTTDLLAASNYGYALTSNMDPNLYSYKSLLLSSDIGTYDFSDDFSNGLSQWTSAGGIWVIQNSTLLQTQVTPYVNAEVSAGETSWSNYTVSVKARSVGNLTDDIALQFRYQDASNTYDFRMQSGLLRVGKYVNGSYALLASRTDFNLNGDTWYNLSVTVKGNNILCYLNSKLAFNVVDNSYSTGKIAFRAEGISAAFDNLTVQTVDRTTELNQYLNYIKGGSTVVVLGNGDLGYFASLMNLAYGTQTTVNSIQYSNSTIQFYPSNVTTLTSSSSQTKTIASYFAVNGETPFVLSINIGSGKLIYLNCDAVESIIDNSSNMSKYNLMSQIGSLIGDMAEAQTVDYSATQHWNYNVAYSMNLKGTVNINTVQLPFSSASIQTNNITFTTTNGKSSTITNATITNLSIQGASNSTITSSTIQLSLFSGGPYTAFDFADGLKWQINLDDATQLATTYSVDNSTYTQTVKGGTITIDSPYATLLTNTPTVSIAGQTIFSSAYIGWTGSSYKVTSEGDEFSIKGNASFTVECSDGTTALLSNLTYTGVATTVVSSSSWNEFDIPWYSILTSPYHLLLVGAIGCIVLVYGVKNLKKKQEVKLTQKTLKR